MSELELRVLIGILNRTPVTDAELFIVNRILAFLRVEVQKENQDEE